MFVSTHILGLCLSLVGTGSHCDNPTINVLNVIHHYFNVVYKQMY